MKKFIIAGTQRTGSSAIAESIGLHPLVACGWEWMLGIPRRKKIKVAEPGLNGDFGALGQADKGHMESIYSSCKEWIGFRWLFSSSAKWVLHPRYSPALWMDGLEGFLLWARSQPNIHIIHIVRQNNLDWLKSIYLAQKAQVYSKKQYPDGLKVEIPIRAAVRRLKSKNWVDSRLSELRRTNPYLLLTYEDFLNDSETIIGNALSFLACQPRRLKLLERRLHRQSKGNISDYLVNLTELQRSLQKYHLMAPENDLTGRPETKVSQ